ncbi:MAG: hypothetical protein ANABAC_1619 [Anaerolineae bacterium]|nr:MAG: hypothetical protein ANABAC_1619 [Anaerolineae bacterium]
MRTQRRCLAGYRLDSQRILSQRVLIQIAELPAYESEVIKLN